MKKFAAVLALLWLPLMGCSIGSPEGEEIAVLVEEFYQAQQAGDIEKLLPFYAGGRAPEQWRMQLEHVQKQLGKVATYQLKKHEINTVLSGRYYIFEYQVTYDSGAQAKEIVTLFDTVEANDKTSVVAHNISAEGFRSLF